MQTDKRGHCLTKAQFLMVPDLRELQTCLSSHSDGTASPGQKHHMKLDFKFSNTDSVEHSTRGGNLE